MTTYRLDTVKLVAAIDEARGPMSRRKVARLLGISPGVFSRLQLGLPPNSNALCSILMWLNPKAEIADYTTAHPPALAADLPAPEDSKT